MENFDQIFTLLVEEGGITFNFDILGSGVINIGALVAILIYVGRDFLGSILEKRQADITKNVQDAEDRLNEANKRLDDAEKQLTQAAVIIDEIKVETVATKKILLESDAQESKKELAIRFGRALATFRSKERQVFLEVKEQIIALVLNQTIIRAKETFGPKKRALMLINETINRLEGELL